MEVRLWHEPGRDVEVRSQRSEIRGRRSEGRKQKAEIRDRDQRSEIGDRRSGEPWFSRLPNAKDITVRQLMNHTIGLVRYELKDKIDPRAYRAP